MEKYICALVCHASDDALGWPNEFKKKPDNMPSRLVEFIEWSKTSGGRYYPYYNFMFKGDYSDDTQLTICTARALQYSNWMEYLAFIELPFWLTYQRGGGSSCKKHAELLNKERKFIWDTYPLAKGDYYATGSNGGVMRLIPQIIKDNNEDLETLVKHCIENNIITHGSPVAVIGTAFYACAMYYFNTTTKIEEPIEAFKKIVEMFEGLNLTAPKDFGSDYIKGYIEGVYQKDLFNNNWVNANFILHAKIKVILDYFDSDPDEVITKLDLKTDSRGSALLCAIGATYLACIGKDAQEVIELGANATGADTDSLAAMAGGLKGLHSTFAELPDYMNQLQDLSYIGTLPNLILQNKELNTASIDPKKMNIAKIKVNIRDAELNTSLPTVLGEIKPYSRGSVGLSATKETICTYALTSWGQRLCFIKHSNL